MSNPVSRRELIAWILLALGLCAVACLAWENYSVKRALAIQMSRAVGDAFNSALGPQHAASKGPSKDENLPVNGATLQIDAVLDGGEHLKFDDGSFWEVVGVYSSVVGKWTKGQNVILVQTKEALGDTGWKLMNQEAASSVNAKPLLVPPPGTKAAPRAEKGESAEPTPGKT
jgi:hypothetical protein